MTFEKLGKTILKHKFLYYIKGEPEVSDYEYDMLEQVYKEMAKNIKEEPEIHLMVDWNEVLNDSLFASPVIGYPFDHPWSKEIEDNEG